MVSEHPTHRAASLRPGLASSRPGSEVRFRLPAVYWAAKSGGAVVGGAAAAPPEEEPGKGVDACSGTAEQTAAPNDGWSGGGAGGAGGADGAGGRLTVTYVVSSTQGMGVAALRCLAPHCSCPATCLDARRPAGEGPSGSVGHAHEVAVALHASHCQVSLRLSNASGRARHRFKVTGLALRSSVRALRTR